MKLWPPINVNSPANNNIIIITSYHIIPRDPKLIAKFMRLNLKLSWNLSAYVK